MFYLLNSFFEEEARLTSEAFRFSFFWESLFIDFGYCKCLSSGLKGLLSVQCSSGYALILLICSVKNFEEVAGSSNWTDDFFRNSFLREFTSYYTLFVLLSS